MVEIHRVSFSYGDNEVLSDITFTWDTNELIYIWGPNGGGKTTLGYIISGLLMPKEGTIKRTDIGEEELLLMLQNPGDMVFTDNVITELAFGLENLGLNKNEMMRRIYWAMRTFELEKFAFESPQRLSGGELSLVVLASLIVMRPRFLILDEPFAHLDWFGRTRIFSALNTIREESSISVLEFGLKKEPSFEASKVYYLNKTLFDSHDEERSEIINIDFPVPGEPIAKLSDLFYIYKGKSKPAICGVDFTINEGEGIGIIGMNGAGKTTLGRLIAGIIKPSKGRVWVKGKCAYLFQFPERQFFKDNIFDDLLAGPVSLRLDNPRERVGKALELVGIPHTEWHSSPFTLSAGKLRRIAFASLIAIDPAIFVLDEPFADLDHNGIKEFALILQEIIKRGKSYIILSSNLSNLFSLVRRVIILKDGRLMWDGKLSEIPYSRREIRELGIVV